MILDPILFYNSVWLGIYLHILVSAYEVNWKCSLWVDNIWNNFSECELRYFNAYNGIWAFFEFIEKLVWFAKHYEGLIKTEIPQGKAESMLE